MKRLPAEWEAQDAVMLTWPHKNTDWLPVLDRVESVYFELAGILLHYTNLIIAAHPAIMSSLQDQFAKTLTRRPHQIYLYPAQSNDTWTRDHGPVGIENAGKKQLLDFTFNGWGNKFAAGLDNQISAALAQLGAFNATQLIRCPFVLEGGAIESDGKGCILTTSACLLNQNRNPSLDKIEVEKLLRSCLGADKVLWLDHGYLAGDDTDSHIDTLARFAPDGVILYVKCDDRGDEHFPALQKMEAQLRTLADRDQRRYRLLPLPWPAAKYDAQGQRLPATYANFLVTNNAVLAPVYGDNKDALALRQLGKAFPGRNIHAVDGSTLITQHGSLHCITMQIPAGVLSSNPNV